MSFIDPSQHGSSEISDDHIHVGELWRAIAQRKSFIAKVTGGLVLLGATYVMHSHPSFTETGSLYTQGLSPSASGPAPSDQNGNSFLGSLGNYQSITDSETQVDTLTSPLLLQQAVLATGLNTIVTNSQSIFPRYLAWHMFHGAKISAFAPNSTALQALYANFSDPSLKSGSYQISFQSNGHYQILNDGLPILNGTLGTPAAGGGLQLLLQSSTTGYIPSAGSTYHLSVINPAITAQNLLNGSLSVTPGGTPTSPSDVINISLKWANPYQGAQFVDQLMNDYINTTVSWNSTAAGATVDFINGQLKNVKDQLDSANEQLATYQQETGVLSPSDNAQNLINQESQYELQQAKLRVKVVALQQMREALNTPASGINPYLLGLDSDTTLSALAEKLGETNATLQSMRIQFTNNAPEVRAEEAQVDQLQTGIRSLVQNQLNEAQSNLDTTNSVIADFQKKIASMPAQSLKVVSLTRSSVVLGQLYVLLMQKQQEAALAKAAEVSTTRILTPAQIPFTASAPRPRVIITFAMIIGLLISTGWVLAQRAFSGRFASEAEVRRILKSPIYGL
ncbi:MAG: GNVR domain-containing protein, partial [Acidocella sp.]|nr:GNVR domain-containing protein [Acidocella sp.]